MVAAAIEAEADRIEAEVVAEANRSRSDAKTGQGKGNGGKGGKASVNARMLETIQKDTAAMGWNSSAVGRTPEVW